MKSQIIPVILKTRAIARSGLFPYHQEKRVIPVELAIKGITKSSVIGPIKNAVRGEADCSTLCAKPNTLPCLSKGTTFWRIVCSAASANGCKTINV